MHSKNAHTTDKTKQNETKRLLLGTLLRRPLVAIVTVIDLQPELLHQGVRLLAVGGPIVIVVWLTCGGG